MLSQDWWGRFLFHSLSWGGPHGGPIASTVLDKVRQLVFLRGNWDDFRSTKKQGFYFTMMRKVSMSWGQRLLYKQLLWRDWQLYEIVYYILWSTLPFAFDNNLITQFFTGILTYTWKLGSYTKRIMYFIYNGHPIYQWKHLRDSHSK